MLLCRVYHVIAIYPKTMGKRQGINEQEILGNQSSTADKKLKTNEFLTFTTRPWSRFSMFELLFIKNSRPGNCEALRWNFSEFYDLNQNLLLNNTFRTLKLKSNIYRSKELSSRRKASIKVRRWICSFPDIIGIAFGNEVFLTPKQIFLLERSTFLLFFEKIIVD